MHILDAYFIEGENMAIQENRVVPLDERFLISKTILLRLHFLDI